MWKLIRRLSIDRANWSQSRGAQRMSRNLWEMKIIHPQLCCISSYQFLWPHESGTLLILKLEASWSFWLTLSVLMVKVGTINTSWKSPIASIYVMVALQKTAVAVTTMGPSMTDCVCQVPWCQTPMRHGSLLPMGRHLASRFPKFVLWCDKATTYELLYLKHSILYLFLFNFC